MFLVIARRDHHFHLLTKSWLVSRCLKLRSCAYNQDIMKKGDDIHKGYITLDEFLSWYEQHCRNLPKDAATKVG